MNCPQCGHDGTDVIASETTHGGEARRRRRECKDAECDFRFTTYEHTPWNRAQVQKRTGGLEDYRTEKLRGGIETAVIDTDVTDETVDEIVEDIEQQIRDKEGEIVTSEFIGNEVADRLLELNGVAFMRFVSVFKGFSRPEQFEKALREIDGDDSVETARNENGSENATNSTDTETHNEQSETRSSDENNP